MGTRPRAGSLHLLIGPVGAGKTTYGRRQAAQAGAVFLDLDTWMVRLFGADSRPQENVLAWYLERRDRVRELLWDLTLDLLRSGLEIFLELGLVTTAEREAFYERARAEELPLRVYLVDAPRDLRRQRVAQRNQAPGEFTQRVPLEHFERASDLWQPPSETERAAHAILDV